jgi:PIN domain nuclease of toxin-antitoxin system
MQEERKLSKRALKALSSQGARLFVSVVSIWEMLVKRHAGKLLTSVAPDVIVQTITSQEAWRILPLEVAHIQALNEIARFTDHADPFDRMLIAQARSEKLNIMTADPQFSRYGVGIVW